MWIHRDVSAVLGFMLDLLRPESQHLQKVAELLQTRNLFETQGRSN